jgi:superfamily II DNA or RNA helicase
MATLLEKPRIGELKVELRPYQEEAIKAVRDEFAKGIKSTLIVLPTGTGKTICFGMMSRLCIEKGGRVLILAHRGELIDQAVTKLDLLGVECGIEKAESHARSMWEPDAVVATVQTLSPKRLETWPKDYFRLIITDEAHHSIADSYRRIYRHFRARHLGVTATADRADEEKLNDVFQSVAYEFSLWDAMTAEYPGPYLCRLRFVQCDVDIDLRGIRTTAGDFNQSDLEERIRPLIDTLANAIRQEIGDRKTLVFTPDVGSAQAMATALQSLGLKADWVSGDDRDRADKVRRLHSGATQILVNCALLIEGFDCPGISAIVLCRPTQSRPMFAQMIGRGTRLAKGKEDCLIVDFNYLTTKHNLVRPVELFDTTHTDIEILDIAQELVRKDKQLDLVMAVEQAEEIHRERQIVRIKARERKVKYRKISYDPLAIHEAIGLPWRGGGQDAGTNKATEKQVETLKKFKVDDADKMSMTRASTLIGILIERSKRGLATHKQVAHLIANGVAPETARFMSFGDASRKLDELFGGSRKPPKR